MPAPIAKGLIIAATVIVAAGIAIYQSPEVRKFVDQSRRKIAIALHSLGDEIQPHRSPSSPRSPAEEAELERRRRQEEGIRRRRSELIRKAREDGVAVDLDELARLGTELHELQSRPPPYSAVHNRRPPQETHASNAVVEKQPEVRYQTQGATSATTSQAEQEQLRFRGRGAEAFHRGSAFANPFDDDAQIMYDRNLIGVQHDEAAPRLIPIARQSISRESTTTLAEDGSLVAPLSPHEAAQTASIHSLPSQGSYQEESVAASAQLNQSFHSFQSVSSVHGRSRSNTMEAFTPGLATPTDDGFSTSASVVDSQADDIAQLTASLHSIQAHDNDDAMSEAFSEISAGRTTPGSWTDVGSDDGSEIGLHQNGLHQNGLFQNSLHQN